MAERRRQVMREAGRPSVVLLLEDGQGAYMAVRFPTAAAARDWEDRHGVGDSARGVASYVSDDQALRRIRNAV